MLDTEAAVCKCSTTGVLKNFAKFIEKHLCWSLFCDDKVAPATLLKKIPRHGRFPLNFAKFLNYTFFYRTTLLTASVDIFLHCSVTYLQVILKKTYSFCITNSIIILSPSASPFSFTY